MYLLLYNITFAERLVTKTGNFQLNRDQLCNVHAMYHSVGLPVSIHGYTSAS